MAQNHDYSPYREMLVLEIYQSNHSSYRHSPSPWSLGNRKMYTVSTPHTVNIPSYMAGTNFWGTERKKDVSTYVYNIVPRLLYM